MVVQVQVLSVDSMETSPSLLVSTETERLLFNVGDGTQRNCMEHHVRLSKVKNIFLTQIRANTLGGLPGMILTVTDSGKKALDIYGPEGTQKWLYATRHFLYRPNCALKAMDLLPIEDPSCFTACYKSSEVSIHPIAINLNKKGIKRKLDVSSPMHSKLSHGYSNDAVSYIIETPEQRGKFLVEKAIALEVPKGKLFGQLHQGKDVILPNGRLVKSSDCVSPSVPGGGAGIIVCPSTEYIESLLESKGFLRYQTQANDPQPPAFQLQVLYHFGDSKVLTHPGYVEFIKRFGPSVQHVLLQHPLCPKKTVFRSSAILQAQLNSIFPDFFPRNDVEKQDATIPFSRQVFSLGFTQDPVHLGESMLKYTLVPASRHGFDASKCFQPIKMEEIETSTKNFLQNNNISIVSASSKVASTTTTTMTTTTTTTQTIGRLTFLGTGSAIPSKYRNVTGIYLEIDCDIKKKKGFLLDCGEGTIGQLWRYTNGDSIRMKEILNTLELVWISHNHADHHLGLLHVLSLREPKMNPLYILGPTPLQYWLKEYSKLDPNIALKYIFVDNLCFVQAKEIDPMMLNKAKILSNLKDFIGLDQIECIEVKHCHLSYAGVFVFTNGFKIAFSGDCRPSDAFAKKAFDADILIHEATFENAMQQEAIFKNHCTIEEAIQIGQQANAKHILLTHFSQRYPKIPPLLSTELEKKVMIAFDLLSLPLNKLLVPQLMEICPLLMAKDDDVDEEEQDN